MQNEVNREEVPEDTEPMPFSDGRYVLEDPEPVQPNLPVMETVPIEPKITTTNSSLIKGDLSGEGWDFGLPSSELQGYIQEDLAKLGKYKGKINGKWGDLSIFAIGEVVGHPVSVPDRELCVRIQEYVTEVDGLSFTDEVRGRLNEEAWLAFASALESSIR